MSVDNPPGEGAVGSMNVMLQESVGDDVIRTRERLLSESGGTIAI